MVTVNYVDDAVRNISRFAELLSLVGLRELGENYKKLAEKLDRDRSDQTLGDTRHWIRETFKYQGSGSIPDRYVAKGDGSADLVLTSEYHGLIHTLGAFVSDGDEIRRPANRENGPHGSKSTTEVDY